ncbi:NADH-quinone oxidoreductase subunit M [compost metagenome]
MIHRAYFGPAKAEGALLGLKSRELGMVMGLAALLILLGIYPQPVLDTSAASMHGVQQWMNSALTQLASAQ